MSDAQLASAGWWGLLGALFAGGGLVLVWVAANWDAVGAAFGGLAAALIGAGLASHAAGIAKRAAVYDSDAGRFKRRRAEQRAVREHAPLSGFAGLLAALAVFANVIWLFAQASN